MNEIVLKGIQAAPGIASGAAFILDNRDFIIPPRSILENEIPSEIARFEEAIDKTRQEILQIQKTIVNEMSPQHAQIFDAHLMVLEDKTLIEEVVNRIHTEKFNAEFIFSKILKKYVKAFSKIQDEYLRERTSDVSDVGKRILKHLMGESKLHELENLTERIIIIAHDLSPSDTASMFNKNIIAFATDIGGRTSHTAIMAKALGIPAVVGLKNATLQVNNQDYVIVDGRMGLLIINPTEKTKEIYDAEQTKIAALRDRFIEIKDLPSQTIDGHEVNILANVEIPEEIPMVLKQGARGIGLYRTEFFYMNRIDLPSEDEQFEAYKSVAEGIAPYSATIRTVDIGGDKFVSSIQIPRDMHPFLSWRAIRFCFARPDIFKTQLRAVLRASLHGKLKLMYPMISGVDELRHANSILNEVKQNLRDEKIPFNEEIEVGAMIEVPSAAMTADLLAREADFFSIGTNDLIQYSLAVDRTNEQTADLYSPGHPAILRMIKQIVEAGHQEHLKISLCGEMSGEPILALLLLGLGIDELSMSSLNILQIKKLIRSVSFKDAQEVVQKAIMLSTGAEVEEFSRAKLQELAPQILNIENNRKNP